MFGHKWMVERRELDDIGVSESKLLMPVYLRHWRACLTSTFICSLGSFDNFDRSSHSRATLPSRALQTTEPTVFVSSPRLRTYQQAFAPGPPSCRAITRTLIVKSTISKRHKLTAYSDLVMCRKTAGIAIGRLCDKCDGKCPVCDSYVRPTTLVRICDECSFGNYQNKCVVCGGEVSI